MHTWMIIQSSDKKMDAVLTFWMHSAKIECRVITLLSFELQASRSVNLYQNGEIQTHARREFRLGENTFRAITLLI